MGWGWLADIGGFVAAPFTGGWSIPAAQAAKGLLGGGGGGGKGNSGDGNPEDPYTAVLARSAQANQTTARELGGLGTESLAPVLEYFKQITSQNPSAVMDATRQERARVIDQYDTARKAIANFAPRGGGAVSVNAQSQFDQAESLADITSSARRDAMTGAAALGTSLTGLGLSASQLASSDLNQIINAVLAREGLNVQRRGQNMELWGGIGEVAGGVLGDILTGGTS